MVVWWVLASLAVVGAITWVVALKADIRHLSRQVSVLAPTGTQAHLTTTTFDPDVVSLVEHVNQMLDRQRDVLNASAVSDAALKSALTNLSHDLRTPLTAAIGYLQMAQTTNDQADKKRYLEIAAARLDGLNELLNQVFTLSQLVEGAMVLSTDRIDLTEQVRAALAEAYPELERHGFAITVDLPAEPVFCNGDRAAIARVLSNLLSNVCNHGTGYVHIRLSETTVEIANQVGDPRAIDPTAIFTRFYTDDQSRTNRHTGLGLAIAQQLTTAMGGRIWATVDGDSLTVHLHLQPRAQAD